MGGVYYIVFSEDLFSGWRNKDCLPTLSSLCPLFAGRWVEFGVFSLYVFSVVSVVSFLWSVGGPPYHGCRLRCDVYPTIKGEARR